jgi:predicted AAA+ superfamily ATPase
VILRLIETKLRSKLEHQSAVGLLGPRQSGKTTVALAISQLRPSLYLDLERPEDRELLRPEHQLLERQQNVLVILDEIQRAPELFPRLRSVIDRRRQAGDATGQFLILGSASPQLLKQSSESLTGRIGYLEMGGLTALEVPAADLYKLWLRGGFPPSYLAANDLVSTDWRADVIRNYMEMDAPSYAPRMATETLRRLWAILGYLQGSPAHLSRLAQQLEVSVPTVTRYVDLLCDMLLVRRLQPWHRNAGKRLVKTPKVYVRDSGMLHTLLNIRDERQLLAHPVMGASWEGFCIENLLTVAPSHTQAYYYRTSAGAELDLVLELPTGERWAVEIKHSLNPKVAAGFHTARAEVDAHKSFIVYNGERTLEVQNGVVALPLTALLNELTKVE